MIPIDNLRISRLNIMIITRHNTQINRRQRPLHLLNSIPRRLKRFINRLKRQSLLRIHTISLSGVDIEERRVKQATVFFKKVAFVADVSGAVMLAIFVVEGFKVEAVFGEVAEAVFGGLEEGPEFGGRGCA